jgi:hypothetical protein
MFFFFRLRRGRDIRSRMAWPVRLRLHFNSSDSLPKKTISPPRSPGPVGFVAEEIPGAPLGVECPAARLPDLAQFAADESAFADRQATADKFGDEFLEELVHVEQEREGFGAAGQRNISHG